MSCFLYFEIAPAISPFYIKEKISWAQEIAPEIRTIDFDLFSEPMLKDYILKLVKENIKTIIYLDVQDEASLKRSLILLEKIMSSNASMLIMSNEFFTPIQVLAKHYDLKYLISKGKKEVQELLINYFGNR